METIGDLKQRLEEIEAQKTLLNIEKIRIEHKIFLNTYKKVNYDTALLYYLDNEIPRGLLAWVFRQWESGSHCYYSEEIKLKETENDTFLQFGNYPNSDYIKRKQPFYIINSEADKIIEFEKSIYRK